MKIATRGWQIAVLLVICVGSVLGRPAVRNIRSNSEFHKLIKHHKENTGLPIVIDYYSDGCGPCRQIAPHYARLAKQFKDRVVFAKVDVNRNRETSGAQMIRSMPTFQFYANGKKVHQFSGGDLNQLNQWLNRLSSEAERNNVRITMDALKAFYTKHAPEKAQDDAALEKVMAKAGGPSGGAGHRKLLKALKKKYGEEPESEKRYDGTAKPKSETKSTKTDTSKQSKGSAKTSKTEPVKPTLDSFTLEEIKSELEKRMEQIEAEKMEQDDDDDEDEAEAEHFALWSPDANGFPERTVIVGGGPAGLSAAIYAARAGLRPVVVAPPSGGQLQGKGVLVENYPAVMGATGPHVVYEMMKQAAHFGTRFHDETVLKVDLSSRPFKVVTNVSTIVTHSVILSTGADARWLNVTGEYEYRGGGVSTCATCDGFLYKDRPVVVIGGGDAAMDDALHLARTSSEVTIIHRRDKFRASHVLAERVLEHPKIKVLWNTTVQEFVGDLAPEEIPSNLEGAEDIKLEHEPDHVQPQLTHVVVKTVGSSEPVNIKCDGVFVAIGHIPNTGILGDQLELDQGGYIVRKNVNTMTSIPGVFAAGDVSDSVYRQAVTSAGSGAMAAIDAERWLDEQGIEDEAAKLEAELMAEVIAETRRDKDEL